MSSVNNSGLHIHSTCTPRDKNALDRAMRYILTGLNTAESPNISPSIVNLIFVPCFFCRIATGHLTGRFSARKSLTPFVPIACNGYNHFR